MITATSWLVRTQIARPVKRKQLRGWRGADLAYGSWALKRRNAGNARQAAMSGWVDHA